MWTTPKKEHGGLFIFVQADPIKAIARKLNIGSPDGVFSQGVTPPHDL